VQTGVHLWSAIVNGTASENYLYEADATLERSAGERYEPGSDVRDRKGGGVGIPEEGQ
jgi:hypothetical protein